MLFRFLAEPSTRRAPFPPFQRITQPPEIMNNPVHLIRGALLAAALVSTSIFAATVNGVLNKDVMAKEKFPTTNFGTDPQLQASAQTGFQKIIYVEFTVSGIPAGSTGISAQLKLRSQTTGTGRAITAHSVTGSWTEAGVTWNAKPALGSGVSTVSSHTSGSDSVWNVTSIVTGNGTFSIGLDSAFSGDTTFSSKEGANAPVLVVTYTPPTNYVIYRGNTHAHSSYSHDTAATNTDPGGLYAIAVNEDYDFFCVTDHSQSPVFQPVSATNTAWVDSKNDALNATVNGSFVAIGGYEHSENNQGVANPNPGTGHLTVLNTNAYLRADDANVDIPYLYNWLKTAAPAVSGTPVVAGFNHPSTTQYNTFGYYDSVTADIIALCEVVNSNDTVYEAGWRAALAHGWKVSPTSGGDTHASCCGIQNDTSRVFVLATGLNRAAILDAMHNRRTYATLHDNNMQIRYSANSAVMGSTLSTPSSFTFNITVTDDTAFDAIEIVGSANDTAILSTTVNGTSKTWTPTLNDTTNKYFYVRVTRGGTRMAWTAPIWTGR